VDFAKLPKKTKLLGKFEVLDKRGFNLMEKRKKKTTFLPPRPTPIHKLSMTSMVWNISTAAGNIIPLGELPGYAPSQLLHTCSVAEYGQLEEVLDFLAATENISVIYILLILNPKHSSYWEGN